MTQKLLADQKMLGRNNKTDKKSQQINTHHCPLHFNIGVLETITLKRFYFLKHYALPHKNIFLLVLGFPHI